MTPGPRVFISLPLPPFDQLMEGLPYRKIKSCSLGEGKEELYVVGLPDSRVFAIGFHTLFVNRSPESSNLLHRVCAKPFRTLKDATNAFDNYGFLLIDKEC